MFAYVKTSTRHSLNDGSSGFRFGLKDLESPGKTNVAIIDLFGLNDRVIARTPAPAVRRRRMAHERVPPSGYRECFLPNVSVQGRRATIAQRQRPLSDDDIRACEARW